MKKLQDSLKTILIAATLLSSIGAIAQNVAINSTGATANASSMLDISSGAGNTLGLLIPRMTNAQRTGIVLLPAIAQGLVVYQTNTVGSSIEGFYYNTSTTTTPAWNYLTSGGWSLTGNAGTTAGTNFIGTTDVIDWVIKTSNTERMRVQSGGNVGIGIAAPLGRLDVQGTTARTGTTATSPSFYVSGTLSPGQTGPAAGNIEFRHDNGTQGIGFGYNTIYQTGSNANQDLNLLSRGSSPLTLNAYPYSTGNVGVGVPNPAYNLEVNGSLGYGNGTSGSYRSRTETRNDAGLMATQSGFYETSAPAPAADWPVGASSWWHLLDVRHSNNGNDYALQIAGSFFDQNLYFRKTNGFANTGWSQLLTTASATTGYIQNQFAGPQTADHWVSGSSRASEVYAANWFRVDGGGGIYWQAYGGGWYMQDATWVRGYNGKSLWMGTGLIGGDQGLTIGYGGATPPINGGLILGNVGIGVNPPTCKLHVQADGDNLPVIYGQNTNITAGTTSYGVRGESGSTGLGSAGVSGVSTNSSQNEIGVSGDYSLWGAAMFGLAWAGAYADMTPSRDYGVFGTVNFGTGTGVYGRNTNVTLGSAYGMYCNGNFAVTGAKAATIPTSKGNQLVYSMESPEVWFEDAGYGKLENGSVHIDLGDIFQEAIFVDDEHPFLIFTQEMGESQGLIVIIDTDWKGFTVKEKNSGTSKIAFSYRIMAKRRFYQDVKFGVDANQPFANNLKDAKYVEPATQDPQVMKAYVDRISAQKEAEDKAMKKQAAQKQKTIGSNGAGENKLDGKTPRPEDPVLKSTPTETKPEVKPPANFDQIDNTNTVNPK